MAASNLKSTTSQKRKGKQMNTIAWITAIAIAYMVGRWQVVNARKQAKAQWKADSWDETPIGTQLAKEMGIEL
jgi:hypothetical protein